MYAYFIYTNNYGFEISLRSEEEIVGYLKKLFIENAFHIIDTVETMDLLSNTMRKIQKTSQNWEGYRQFKDQTSS